MNIKIKDSGKNTFFIIQKNNEILFSGYFLLEFTLDSRWFNM